jgi:hypothetical protein
MTCALNQQLNLVPEGGGIVTLAATIKCPGNPRTDHKLVTQAGICFDKRFPKYDNHMKSTAFRVLTRRFAGSFRFHLQEQK